MLFFKRKKNQVMVPTPETEEVTFSFPLYVDLYHKGFENKPDYEPKRLTGKEAYNWIMNNPNGKNYIAEVCDALRMADLQQYYPSAETIFSFDMRIIDTGIALITATVKKEISDAEKTSIYEFLNAQLADGWGEDSIPSFEADEDDFDYEEFQISFWDEYNKQILGAEIKSAPVYLASISSNGVSEISVVHADSKFFAAFRTGALCVHFCVSACTAHAMPESTK